MASPSGALTGNKAEGNPYEGDFQRGIDYDTYEVNFMQVIQEGNFPEVVGGYRAGARKLLKYSSVVDGAKVLDLGFGTGILTLELLNQRPNSSVLGLEISQGMMEVAKYKFHQSDGSDLLARVSDQKLLHYWHRFRQKSKKYQDKVALVLGDIQNTAEIEESSIDAAVASQVIHWTNPEVTFAQLRRFLRKGREIIWNSASHWYNDFQFPALEYSFRLNDFLKYILEDVGKKYEVQEILKLSLPQQNLDSIREVTAKQGFETRQIATYLLPIDLQVFVQFQIPACVSELVVRPSGLAPEEAGRFDAELKACTLEAVSRAIVRSEALADVKHKYDIVPIFRSVKK